MTKPVLPYRKPEGPKRLAPRLELISIALFLVALLLTEWLGGFWFYLAPAFLLAGIGVAVAAIIRTRARSVPAWLLAALNFFYLMGLIKRSFW